MIICADARRLPLGDETVQCVVTSPPYWGLRKYAGEQELVWGGDATCEHRWEDEIRTIDNNGNNSDTAQIRFNKESRYQRQLTGSCRSCGAWRGAYGLEPAVEAYVEHSVEILRELRRVLRRDGVVFWNVGDSYSGGHVSFSAKRWQHGSGPDNEQHRWLGQFDNLKPKDLALVPFRVALAAQADGWWVRSVIIWAKPNPMPESVTDRPTDAYEHILMLTRSARYFYDAEAVAEKSVTGDTRKPYAPGQVDSRGDGHARGGGKETGRDGASRNLRNVWEFPTQPYSGAHFATFPEELPRRAILAATSARGACRSCGAPWERVEGISTTVGWRPTCRCRGQRGSTRPCLVLDPFGGSGTTARVAIALGREPILVDLAYDAAYRGLAEKRTSEVQLQMFK